MNKAAVKKNKYTKPTVKKKYIKINSFFRTSRNFEGFDQIWGMKAFAASSTCGCGSDCNICFLSGTRILVKQNIWIEVQNIKVGDTVSVYSRTYNKLIKRTITETFSHIRPDGYIYINNKLRITKDHPILINNSVWKEARKIKNGDYLTNSEGEKIEITQIEKIKGINVVYNIQLEGIEQNYFAEDILVRAYGKYIQN